MNIFSQVLKDKVFDLDSRSKGELETFEKQFSEVNSVIATSLDAIGTIIFWATTGDSNGDNRIPECDAINAFSRIGELMQILSALSVFCLTKEVQCRNTLESTVKNNKAPETAINGASNIQPTTI